MDKTPAPISLAAARVLPWRLGQSAEAFRDGDLEVRFTGRPATEALHTHERDELYIVASGTGTFRVEDKARTVSAGDLLFAAAHVPHGFTDYSGDFAVWIVFYEPTKCERSKMGR
jgi:quercetin dioxygenase-like cupin family protein